MSEYKNLSTCQRRGYQLTDLKIWQAFRGHKALGYERDGEPCDPPEYIDLGIGEHPRTLPPGSKIIDKKDVKPAATIKTVETKTKTEYNGDITLEQIISAMQSVVDERNALLAKVEELESRPVVVESKEPEVELVDQWRLQFNWYGSAGDLEEIWGFRSRKLAEERFERWQSTFPHAKFDDVEIIHYKINEEGIVKK